METEIPVTQDLDQNKQVYLITMVGISIQCRLGNQLFQYAFITALSKKLNTKYFISEKIERFTLPDYFELPQYSSKLNFLRKLILKIKKGYILKPLQHYEITQNTPAKDNEIYVGYFQSESFFEETKDNIGELIKVRPEHKNAFNNQFEKTFSKQKTIAIHLRRGDYLNLDDWWLENLGGNNLTLPITYYEKCFAAIKNLNNYRLLFISDDIAFARLNFGHLENAEFHNNELIIDFQIMMNADICIVSNSSFAWWAAYLNAKSTKKIFCPEYWLGFNINTEYPKNIIPDSWEQIAVK